MNVHINQLVKSLLQKDSIEQCSLQELQQFADSNPHFGAAQLLLTKKLKAENSDRYNEQLQKTFLYFHNPMWVEHLLNETGSATVKAGQNKSEALPVADSTPETPQIPLIEIAEAETTLIADNTATAALTEVALAETDATEPETEEMQEQKNSSIITDESLPATQSTTPVSNTTADIPSEAAIPPTEAGEALLFEPYHTVDYFASQGIKLKEADKGTDKFSQQLRSFTDWLKTLKKVPAAEITKQPASVSEKKVEQMAAYSLQEGDVLTETMAEVWEKQGNTAKAIDLYNKLSLLEPDKSTYFAAKIDELKKQL